MRMIPDTPHGTRSHAERRVFDKLRAMDLDEERLGYTAYHSLNLTEHEYKRFGEIDFLITGPAGIFVLEVKGGRVACHQGVWQFTDRFGQVHQKVEGPFKQAESALHGLLRRVRQKLPDDVVDRFCIGFGVISPDQHWSVSGVEWNPHTIADSRGFNDMANWLQQLFKYWQAKDRNKRPPDQNLLKALNNCIRPDFETIIPLYALTSAVEERVASLTEDQMVMVDVVYANKRVLCSGGAGTGKTFMALELARRWTASGLRVLLVCRSPWLKNYLEVMFAMPGLTVSVVDGVESARQRAGVEYFDALLVDEGQDMFDMESLGKLAPVLQGSLETGHWCIFHDMNNQARVLGKFAPIALERLHLLKTAEVPLRINCRNTKVILEKVQKDLGADMGVKGIGMGPDIREHYGDYKTCGRILEREIGQIIEYGGLTPGNLTILSPNKTDQSCISLLPDQIRKKIVVLDEYAVRSFPIDQISFANIVDFKGLENEAIIIIDLPPPEKTENLATHYVGMSRPRAILSLIYLNT